MPMKWSPNDLNLLQAAQIVDQAEQFIRDGLDTNDQLLRKITIEITLEWVRTMMEELDNEATTKRLAEVISQKYTDQIGLPPGASHEQFVHDFYIHIA